MQWCWQAFATCLGHWSWPRSFSPAWHKPWSLGCPMHFGFISQYWQHPCPWGIRLSYPWHCCTSSACACQTTWPFYLPNDWKVKDLCRNKPLISNALLHEMELLGTTVSEYILMILEYPLTYSSFLSHHDKIFMIAIKNIPSSTLAACLLLWQRDNGTNIEKLQSMLSIT